jgi:hypothetical protein
MAFGPLRWIGSAVACSLLAGCASVAPNQSARERLVLEKNEERVVMARAGRFVIQTQSSNADVRGAQGRFEWLEYQSVNHGHRQVLVWLGPFGQSAASIEQRIIAPSATGSSNTEKIIAVYDEQGFRLAHQDQLRFMSAVLGRDSPLMNDGEIHAALAQVMDFFQQAIRTQALRHESQFRMGNTAVGLRIALDPS